jgi:putative transposase
LAFEDTSQSTLKDKLAEERKEKEQYAKKVGQLTMQVDWLKKNLRKYLDPTTRQSILKNLSTTKELPVSTAADLLDVNRTSIYYKPVGISEKELICKSIIDRLHTDNPAWGARQMSQQLKKLGHKAGRKKARRYMTDMAMVYRYKKPGKRGIMPADKVSFYNCIDMGIFICFMDICLGHSGIDFDKILYPDTGEDKEYVLNAKYKLD